ncbi:hypothetical protein ACFLXG_00880 [Chloroflexota bacterium]
MSYNDSVKKSLAGFSIVIIFVGTVMAITGVYLEMHIIMMVGCVIILVGMFIIEMVFRKYGEF